MSDEPFNMSMRKFLKQVGVTSQQEIEKAVREAGPQGKVTVSARVTCPELGLDHVIAGQIDTGDSGEDK